MSRVDTLIKSRENPSVKFLQFTRINSKYDLIAFFEGEDEKYYNVRISNILPDITWAGLNCGGKSSIVEIRNMIRGNKSYCNSHCAFFVDADFDNNDELSHLSDMYITPCYSIENFYISKNVFSKILNSEFNICESSEDNSCYLTAIDVFEKTKIAYIDSIKEFNYLIRELRVMESKKELTSRLNINNVNLSALVDIGIGYSKKIYNENIPNSIFSELPSDLIINLDESKCYLENLNGELWFRGKQNLEFFRIFLQKIKEDRCKKTGRCIFKEKGNVRLQLSKLNCISELSQYAETPKCLHEFLSKLNVAA